MQVAVGGVHLLVALGVHDVPRKPFPFLPESIGFASDLFELNATTEGKHQAVA